MEKSAMYFQNNESNQIKLMMIECGLTPSQVARDLSVSKQELLEALKEDKPLDWLRNLIKAYLINVALLEKGELKHVGIKAE